MNKIEYSRINTFSYKLTCEYKVISFSKVKAWRYNTIISPWLKLYVESPKAMVIHFRNDFDMNITAP